MYKRKLLVGVTGSVGAANVPTCTANFLFKLANGAANDCYRLLF